MVISCAIYSVTMIICYVMSMSSSSSELDSGSGMERLCITLI